MTLYRMTFAEVYDLSDKDTGDEAGDTSFVLSRKNQAWECRKDPTANGCDSHAIFNGDETNNTDLVL